MTIKYLVQDLYPLTEQIHRWLQVLCGCKQKMVLAKWRGIKREGGGSPCDQRKNWVSGTGRSRVLELRLWVFGIKSRCFLPLCHSSQGSSSAKKSLFGPGVVRALIWCPLEGEGVQDSVTTIREKRLSPIPMLTQLFSPHTSETQILYKDSALAMGTWNQPKERRGTKLNIRYLWKDWFSRVGFCFCSYT